MAGGLITTDWQIELGGLLMGPNTPYVVRRFNPWAAPQVRTAVLDQPRDHGLVSAGPDYLGQRLVSASFYVDGPDDVAARQALVAAWGPVEAPVPLVWQEAGVKYRLVGKPQLADADVAPGMPTECRFLATDPRVYANVLTSAVLSLPTPVGGFGFPFGFPFGFGTAVSGLVDFANTGRFPTLPTVTFVGPLTGPSVENVTVGAVWRSTFDLPAGQSLVVDFAARTVLLDGVASRYSHTPADAVWWGLVPGVNQLRLGASAGSGSGTVQARAAWLA